MTRKHFEAIAASMKDCLAYVDTGDGLAQHVLYCQGMANTLARFNPAFDRNRFLEACGV